MYRVFRRYCPHAPYDGIVAAVRADQLPLDEVTCAGMLRIKELYAAGARRGLGFVDSLQMILSVEAFKGACNGFDKGAEVSGGSSTAPKWKKHLRRLEKSTILQKMSKSEVKWFSKYFAVPKGDLLLARAILNLRDMSRYFKPPPPVNLPDVGDVLRHISAGGQWWIVADWRHYFHQFRLEKGLWPYFAVESGRNVWAWTTIPMGWSFSPRVAQCASWTLILEAAFRAKLLDPEPFRKMPHPPASVRTERFFLVVWYDNLLCTFRDVRDRDAFDEKIREVCGDSPKGFRVEWKSYEKYNMANVTINCSKKPVYLGVEFAMRPLKQPRDSLSRNFELVWRHEQSRIARWNDIAEPHREWTPRQFARAVGVRLWDATISARPLCDEREIIEILAAAGLEAYKNGRSGWDTASRQDWSEKTLTYLKAQIAEVRDKNPWRTHEQVVYEGMIFAASDASGTIGYGGVTWNSDEEAVEVVKGLWQINCGGMIDAHIFLKEYLAATLTVERLCQTHNRKSIMLCVDNTAVVHSLRAWYSSNRNGCEYIQRIRTALQSGQNQLTVIPVISEDNAADASSRGQPIDSAVVKRCNLALQLHLSGYGMCGLQANPAPSHVPGVAGERRHTEPEIDILLDDRMLDGINDEIPSEDGDPISLEPIIGADLLR